jgi:tetratricopeptide (TPR) repeat protein
VTGGGLLLLFTLFFLGRTTKPTATTTAVTNAPAKGHDHPDTESILAEARKSLTPSQSAFLATLEGTVHRGDVVSQRINAYEALAAFWRDSARALLPFLWYTGEKAKLEKSEKNLNFAAHALLEEVRGQPDPGRKAWMAEQAQALFNESLALNPSNDSAIVGLGSTYFFHAGPGGAPMEGILKIREVAARDSTNMFAQFMLGYGGLVSGQFDKAAERFEKVVAAEPWNKEAIFLLAESFERSGNRDKAAYWYGIARTKVDNPEAVKAIDEKIKSLQ